MPIAATTQRVAAVVSPRTEGPWRMIAPAPRKPMPVTICAAIRVGSARTTDWPEARNSWNPYAETIVKRADPTETSRWVRRPASRSRSSRSTPIRPPSTAARAIRRRASLESSVGSSDKSSVQRLLLGTRDLVDPAGGEVEQAVEAFPVEGDLLRRRLHLDEPAAAGHHDVHVPLRLRILRVVEVEQGLAADDADRDRRDGARQRLGKPEAVERATRRHIGPADRGAAGAAVGLEDVAVEPERPLAERAEVRHRPQRAADQPLDLDRPTALLPPRRLPVGAVTGRRGQE